MGAKDTKLLEIVSRLDGDYYLSGPAAKSYIQNDLLEQAGVKLLFKDYSGYLEYQQSSSSFEPHVSTLDLLFMVGDEAPEYIWGTKRARPAPE